jgi:hypothetical protein
MHRRAEWTSVATPTILDGRVRNPSVTLSLQLDESDQVRGFVACQKQSGVEMNRIPPLVPLIAETYHPSCDAAAVRVREKKGPTKNFLMRTKS